MTQISCTALLTLFSSQENTVSTFDKSLYHSLLIFQPIHSTTFTNSTPSGTLLIRCSMLKIFQIIFSAARLFKPTFIKHLKIPGGTFIWTNNYIIYKLVQFQIVWKTTSEIFKRDVQTTEVIDLVATVTFRPIHSTTFVNSETIRMEVTFGNFLK